MKPVADSIVNNALDDSLDLVEWLMERNEGLSVELSEDDVERLMKMGLSKYDLERCLRGEPPEDWLTGSPVPRRDPPPTRPDSAEAPPPTDELLDEP